jgi:hypothetical protein
MNEVNNHHGTENPDTLFENIRSRRSDRRVAVKRMEIFGIGFLLCSIIGALMFGLPVLDDRENDMHKLRFKNAPMTEIVTTLQDEFGILIQIEDLHFYKYQYNGVLYVATGEDAIDHLCKAWGISYHKLAKNAFRLKKI